jgi:glucosamine-6-phosphate deaminase
MVMGLPTGETPAPFYEALVRLHVEFGLDLSRATLFNLDEYLGLPRSHPSSFATYMERHLIGRLGDGPLRWHIPSSEAGDPADETARYERTIRQAGVLDLIVLGIGTNGHIAFNEPGESFSTGVVVATLSDETRRRAAAHFGRFDQVPREAITMGVGLILEAREVLMLATGAAKAAALAAALAGPVTPRIPASALQGHPSVTVLADREAARDLVARLPLAGVDVRE